MSIVIIVSVLAYLIGAGATWRHLGYKFDAALFSGKWHGFQSICGACNCKNCGDSIARHHRPGYEGWYIRCQNYERRRMHFTAVAGSLLLSLLVWVPVATVYLLKFTLARMGIVYNINFKFFTPAPAIETPEQKRERIAEERKQRIAELEAENAKLAKELGLKP